MSFKQLNLDRARFQALINEFFSDEATVMVQRGNALWEIRREVDNKEMILQFHFLNDGRTTINYKVGKNQESSRSLAEYIKDKALVDPRHNIYLSFKNFGEQSLKELMEYLSLVPGIKLIEDKQIPSGQRIIKFVGEQKDEVTFVYHVNSTLQLQGRPVTLYCQVIAFLSEYLSLGDIIESQSKFIPVPIKIADIEYELDSRMPLAHKKLDPTTRKMIGTSIAFTKIDIKLPDYTAFVFPVLRSLEGQLKSLFFGKGISILDRDGFGPYFDRNGRKYHLKPGVQKSIGCSKTCSAIEDSYNYYTNHRHSLFHAEIEPVGSTIIENRDEALRIINTVIEIIEQAHRSLS